MDRTDRFVSVTVAPRWRGVLLALAFVAGLILSPVSSLRAQEPAPAGGPAPAEAPKVITAPAPAKAAAPAKTDDPGEVPTIPELFAFNPYINSVILALSVISVVLFLYMFLFLAGKGFNPPRFVDDVVKLVLNRQFEQAIHLCQMNSQVFVSSIVQRMVENRDKDHAVLIEIINTEGRRRSEVIWNRVNLLSEISNVAPLVGLVGTVWGMIEVFYTLTTRTAGERAAQLAGGIGVAMGATLFGLIVAISASFFYAMLRSRATVALAESEQVCHTIADHISRAGADPRLKKIDALAEAARQKITMAATARTVQPTIVPAAAPIGTPGFGPTGNTL